MNTKTKEGARNKRNPYFLRVPWNKGGLVNTGPYSQFQTYTQSPTQSQPYISINSNLVFSCKILSKYMLKLKFESEIELRNILANQIP